MKLHPIQERLLILMRKKKGDIEDLSLRKIGEMVDVFNKPQIIAHHLQKLEEKGYIRKDSPASKKYIVLNKPISDVVWINRYGFAQCGPEGLLGDDEILEKIPLSSKTFNIEKPDNYFLVEARGKSMEPLIKDGDLILAKKQIHINNGQLAVVVHDETPKIKKVITDSKTYCLVSLNPEYSEENIIENENDLRVVGLVKSIIRTSASIN
jgi:repressor LexA